MTNRKERPILVTWLALAVFFLSAGNLGGVYAGFTRWPVLATLDLALPTWVLMLRGGIWGAVWLFVAWGLWRLLPWARRATIILFALYELTTIGQQVIFTRGVYERGRLPFAIVTAVLLVALVSLVLTRPRIRRAFQGESYPADHRHAGEETEYHDL